MLNLIRLPKVKSKTGYCGSTVYANVTDQTLTPPIKIGPRASAWPEYEIDAIIAARIAGKSDDDIRELVNELTAKREFLLADVLAAT